MSGLKFFDAITGRSRPRGPNLDALFGVPSAAITLETAAGFVPSGAGSVCYRAATGAAFAQTEQEIAALIAQGAQGGDLGDPTLTAERITTSQDSFGFTWLTLAAAQPQDSGSPDLASLCTDLHAVNTSLELAGFGPSLLCTVIPFEVPGGRRVGLVYLYKRGTFYPFAQVAGAVGQREQRRDSLLEIQVRELLENELPIEPDLQKWLALWDAPGL